MAGRTVSAYTDEATAAKVAEMARREDRSPAQIAAAALRFYVRLPAHARDAWRSAEALDDKAIDEAAWAVGRALLNKRYDRLLAEGLTHFKSPLPVDAPEQDILDHAATMTKAP